MIRTVVRVGCLAMGILAMAGTAAAVPVTFQGGEFDVSVTDQGSDVYRFVYTADFTGWDDSTNDNFIGAIDFGLQGWGDIESVVLVSDDAPGDWFAAEGSASANGCSFDDGGFKICAEDTALPGSVNATTDDDQTYTWVIDVTYGTVGDPDALTAANPIKAVFFSGVECKTQQGVTTCEAKQSGNMSLNTVYDNTSTTSATTDTTTTTDTTDTTGIVPEPALLSLFGISILAAGRRLRRKTE